MIKLTNIYHHYGIRPILRDVSLHVEPGQSRRKDDPVLRLQGKASSRSDQTDPDLTLPDPGHYRLRGLAWQPHLQLGRLLDPETLGQGLGPLRRGELRVARRDQPRTLVGAIEPISGAM